ncbi:MAG TPA: hypothetical protein VFF86_01410 [Candidatus Methylomirabilis sp.]|nr:hypothetical protein [Candidatus Methylomirabilis sp.]
MSAKRTIIGMFLAFALLMPAVGRAADHEGKAGNPCNPCATKQAQPCNPCAAKNPCGTK